MRLHCHFSGWWDLFKSTSTYQNTVRIHLYPCLSFIQCWSSPVTGGERSRSTSLRSVIFIDYYQLIPSVKCHFRHACGMRVMFRCFKLGMRKAKMTINWPLTGAKSYYHLTFRGKTVLSFDLWVIAKLFSVTGCSFDQSVNKNLCLRYINADDNQLYMIISPSESDRPSAYSRLENCVVDVKQWMTSNGLMLNIHWMSIIE